MRFFLESTGLKKHLLCFPLRQELQLTFQHKSPNPVRKHFYTGHSVCFQIGIDVIIWPASETWAELLVEVPVEVETTISAPLDLLTLKKDCMINVNSITFFFKLQDILNKVFN